LKPADAMVAADIASHIPCLLATIMVFPLSCGLLDLWRSRKRRLNCVAQERTAEPTRFGTPSTVFHVALEQRHIGTPRFDRPGPLQERPKTCWYIIYISNIPTSTQLLSR
jgi:hypothetical protein